MAIHAQPAGTAEASGPEIQWTADAYSDIVANAATLVGSYVQDLSTGKVYIIQDDQTIVYTKFIAAPSAPSFPVSVPAMYLVPAGVNLLVPVGYIFITSQDFGLEIDGNVELGGNGIMLQI